MGAAESTAFVGVRRKRPGMSRSTKGHGWARGGCELCAGALSCSVGTFFGTGSPSPEGFRATATRRSQEQRADGIYMGGARLALRGLRHRAAAESHRVHARTAQCLAPNSSRGRSSAAPNLIWRRAPVPPAAAPRTAAAKASGAHRAGRERAMPQAPRAHDTDALNAKGGLEARPSALRAWPGQDDVRLDQPLFHSPPVGQPPLPPVVHS